MELGKKTKIGDLNHKPLVWYGKKANTGILLVHGFTGTPKEMHDCGSLLSELGYRCLSITLSGHATRKEDLLNVEYKDWLNDIHEGVKKLKKDGCKKVWVLGYSLGAGLALLYASENKVKGVISIAPCIDNLWFYKWIVKILSPLKKYLYVGINLKKKYLRYPLIPLDSVEDVLNVYTILSFKIPVKVPVLFIRGQYDEIISEKGLGQIVDNVIGKRKEIIIVPNCTHSVVIDIDKKTIEKIDGFIKKYK